MAEVSEGEGLSPLLGPKPEAGGSQKVPRQPLQVFICLFARELGAAWPEHYERSSALGGIISVALSLDKTVELRNNSLRFPECA